MPDDIIAKIDATLLAERNSKRFDPFGPDWDEDRVERVDDAMRVRPARTGIEEEAEPVEAAVDLPAPNGPPVATGDSSPAARRQFIANTIAFQRALTHPRCARCRRFTPQPSDECDACVESNGSAPTDRVADAMRSEVLRQGLTSCEIDGVRQEYRDGQWLAAGGVVRSPWRPFGVSRECAMSSGSRCGACDGHALDNGSCMHNCHGLEPVAPPVDAALEPGTDVTLMPAGQFDELLATIDEPAEAPALQRAFARRWRRLFPGRSTR
jgi:hypothetical protein